MLNNIFKKIKKNIKKSTENIEFNRIVNLIKKKKNGGRPLNCKSKTFIVTPPYIYESKVDQTWLKETWDIVASSFWVKKKRKIRMINNMYIIIYISRSVNIKIKKIN